MDLEMMPTLPSAFPAYSLAERDRRWKLARDLMDEQGVEALLIFGEREHVTPDNYLTNDRPGMTVLFPRNGEMTALTWSTQVIASHIEGRLRNDASWVSDLRTGRDASHIVELIREKGLERSVIGVVGLEGYHVLYPHGTVPYALWARVLETLPHARFKSLDVRFAELTLAKSEEELTVLRRSAEAGERMCAAMLEATRPGVTEADIYAATMAACHRMGVNATWMILQTGPDNSCWGPPAWTYRPQAPRTIKPGDIVMAELFPTYGMLETQQQMCIAVGEIDQVHQRCAAAARRAYEIGLEVLRPGVTFGEVEEAMERPVVEVGGWHLTPMIHSLNPLQLAGRLGFGLDNLPLFNSYRRVQGRLARFAEVELRPGMAFAFEPNCHLGKRRINIGGTVVVTESGAEELNTLPNYLHRV